MNPYWRDQLIGIFNDNLEDIETQARKLEKIIQDMKTRDLSKREIAEILTDVITDFEGRKFDMEWAKGIVEREI